MFTVLWNFKRDIDYILFLRSIFEMCLLCFLRTCFEIKHELSGFDGIVWFKKPKTKIMVSSFLHKKS